MIIKKLHLNEIEELYESFLLKDFPADELKTLKTITNAYQAGRYACYVMEEADNITAYACFAWYHEEVKILDYFAVSKEIRQKGYGSKMLTWIKDNPDINELIVESEDPEYGDSPEETRIREKRLDFYKKNGFIKRKTKVSLGGVAFNLMTLTDKLSEKDLLKELTQIYQFSSPNLKINPY